jgi:hypothetical protein
LPFDSEIYTDKIVYNTLRTIGNLNYNYTLYLIYNKKKPKISNKKNIVFIKQDFNSIFMAFNLVLDSINYFENDYITFLTPIYIKLMNPLNLHFIMKKCQLKSIIIQ